MARMIEGLAQALRGADPWDVQTWPLKTRRAFLLVLPVSGPLWLAWIAASIVVALAGVCVLGPVVWAIHLWAERSDNR